MITLIKEWFLRNFSNQQAGILTLVLIALAVLIFSFGTLLTPVFGAIIIAYLLNDVIFKIQKITNFSYLITLSLVFISFIAIITFILIAILPDVIQQLGIFAGKVPGYLESANNEINRQIALKPQIFNSTTVNDISQKLTEIIAQFTQQIFSQTLAFLPNILIFFVYLILIPMLTWFLLKDKNQMFAMIGNLMPKDYSLTTKVWQDVDIQLQNYIRGKLIEIIVVGVATYLCFIIFNLQFALLLAVLVGFSVLIPYVGVMVASVPVALVAYAQFGINNDLFYALSVFTILQVLDAYVLVPILFAKAIDMHPIVIIIAILFFGGLWGFWGLFFAIPLAVLVKAVFLVWPRETA